LIRELGLEDADGGEEGGDEGGFGEEEEHAWGGSEGDDWGEVSTEGLGSLWDGASGGAPAAETEGERVKHVSLGDLETLATVRQLCEAFYLSVEDVQFGLARSAWRSYVSWRVLRAREVLEAGGSSGKRSGASVAREDVLRHAKVLVGEDDFKVRIMWPCVVDGEDEAAGTWVLKGIDGGTRVRPKRKFPEAVKRGDVVYADVTPTDRRFTGQMGKRLGSELGKLQTRVAHARLVDKLGSSVVGRVVDRTKVMEEYGVPDQGVPQQQERGRRRGRESQAARLVGSAGAVFMQVRVPGWDVPLKAVLLEEDQLAGDAYEVGREMPLWLYNAAVEPGAKALALVSRRNPELVTALLRENVPELRLGLLELVRVARDSGRGEILGRCKVGVRSNDAEVDAVSACLGPSGMRMRVISEQLGGESVDIVPWSDDPVELIRRAMYPAPVDDVQLVGGPDAPQPRYANVLVADDQVGLAIGNKGQNVKLAAKITGWNISVRSAGEAQG